MNKKTSPHSRVPCSVLDIFVTVHNQPRPRLANGQRPRPRPLRSLRSLLFNLGFHACFFFLKYSSASFFTRAPAAACSSNPLAPGSSNPRTCAFFNPNTSETIGSLPPSETRKYSITPRAWPSRYNRPRHCSCTPGDQSNSPCTIVEQRSCNPSSPAPARNDIANTFVCPVRNFSTSRCFCAGVSDPVNMLMG